jgi:hypothetical protein
MYGDYDKDRCCMYCGEVLYATDSMAGAADWDNLLSRIRRKPGHAQGSPTAA